MISGQKIQRAEKTLTPATVLVLKSYLETLIQENLDLKSRLLAQSAELGTLLLDGDFNAKVTTPTETKTSPS